MDITKAFEVNSLTVYDFFTRGRIGFNIPQYQRAYSWDNENVNQLMDDICSGMFDVLSSENEIHFMGTIITVVDEDFSRRFDNPLQKRSHPTRVENIIDGQQRISTISVLACCLYEALKQVDEDVPQTEEYSSLKEATLTYFSSLYSLFSYNLETRGTPPRKPILIREGEDEWTIDGNEDEKYRSEVTNFIAKFIRADSQNSDFPKIQVLSQLLDNINTINDWLDKYVKAAHTLDESEQRFPSASQIIDKINQEEFWDYPRTEEASSIKKLVNANDDCVCTLIQLLAFSYYLLKCCCFTSIIPTSEVRAFDMFQSLNATGTPLTALETFKPLVINSIRSEGRRFEDSRAKEDFSKIEDLFEKLRSASSKNQRTNEYLTLFAQAYDGSKLARQFSKQRNWLKNNFDGLENLRKQEDFVRKMGDVALYSKQLIYSGSTNSISISLAETAGETLSQSLDSQEAAMCLLYLIDAKHKMAHTILSRFYAVARHSIYESEKKAFLLSCKSLAAFFTLWRSALARKYPDGEYRKLLQNEMSWHSDLTLSIEELNQRLRNILNAYNILDKSSWVDKASQNLRYSSSKTVCKFVLFLSSQDTIADPEELGLMMIGTPNSTPGYLGPVQWNSPNLETIEHVAPQDSMGVLPWDPDIYEEEAFDKIGNLTLLPSKVNTSASNRGWIEKFIYYKHLAENNPNNLEGLYQLALEKGINLSSTTIDLLKSSSFSHHIFPIVQLGIEGDWDKSFIDKRSRRICEVVWERIQPWLE